MTLRDRKSMIRELIPQVKPLMSKGSVYTEFEVPGSKPHSKYHVYVSPMASKKSLGNGEEFYEFSCTCHEKSDPSQFPQCKGNSWSGKRKDTVCKHCIAALIFRLEKKGIQVSIMDFSQAGQVLDNATRLLRIGGTLMRLISNQGDGAVWLVGKKKEKSFEDRVELLRGPVEEGIE